GRPRHLSAGGDSRSDGSASSRGRRSAARYCFVFLPLRFPELIYTAGFVFRAFPFCPESWNLARYFLLQRSLEFSSSPFLPPSSFSSNRETGASGRPRKRERTRLTSA